MKGYHFSNAIDGSQADMTKPTPWQRPASYFIKQAASICFQSITLPSVHIWWSIWQLNKSHSSFIGRTETQMISNIRKVRPMGFKFLWLWIIQMWWIMNTIVITVSWLLRTFYEDHCLLGKPLAVILRIHFSVYKSNTTENALRCFQSTL